MGWLELTVVALFAAMLFGVDPVALAFSTCPECKQARLRQTRDLGELWGQSTRFSTCPACGSHFRHDSAQLVKTGPGPELDEVCEASDEA